MGFLDESIDFDHEELIITESARIHSIEKQNSPPTLVPQNKELLKAVAKDANQMVDRFRKDYSEENKEQEALMQLGEMVDLISEQNGYEILGQCP